VTDKERSDTWNKVHRLWSELDYFIQERDSKCETVMAKHAWDMILKHLRRELADVKEMLREKTQLVTKDKNNDI
jgi:hypothetical protein